MTLNLNEYISKEIPKAEFISGVKHFFYSFPNGRGAHVVYWPNKLPGYTDVKSGQKLPEVDLTDKNWDFGFQSTANEPATRWEYGLSASKMMEAVESAFTAPPFEE